MANGFDFLKKPSSGAGGGGELPQWNAPKPKPVNPFEPKETFIGYQDAANYVLLSGPYEEQELTAFTMGKAWARFGKDTSLTMSFPLDKRDYKRLTTFSVPTSAKRKGAYGRL